MSPLKLDQSYKPSQLDRIAASVFFLGAIGPLVALSYVVHEYVLPNLTGVFATALMGLVISVAILTLGSFFVLRRVTRASLERMNQDNGRLAALLEVSSSLANAEYGDEAASQVTASALELSGADAAYLLERSEGEKPEILEKSGAKANELFASDSDALKDMAALVIENDRPAMRGSAEVSSRSVGAAIFVPVAGESEPWGALAVVHRAGGGDFESVQVDSLSTLAALASVSLSNADLRDSQRNFFAHVTELLVTALDAHLDYHKGHTTRVAQFANRIGRALELEDSRMQQLHFGSLLHDIGMLKLDRSYMTNVKARQKHTVIGGRMMSQIRLWEELAPMIQSHHERWDGAGYPDHLEGEEIPLEARIIAICDAFDSMTSQSSYKIAIPIEEALEELEAHAGTQFDPELVKVVHKLVSDGIITV